MVELRVRFRQVDSRAQSPKKGRGLLRFTSHGMVYGINTLYQEEEIRGPWRGGKGIYFQSRSPINGVEEGTGVTAESSRICVQIATRAQLPE